MEMIFLNQVKAISISETDLDRIYEICLSNPDYYRHMNEELSKEKLKKLMIGYLAMVESYPDEKTALIGFFVLDASLQGKGTGSLIIDNIANDLKEKGFKSIILSCASTNRASLSFWEKNDFFKAEDNEIYDDIELVIMEKNLE